MSVVGIWGSRIFDIGWGTDCPFVNSVRNVQLSAMNSAELGLQQQDLLHRLCQLIGQWIYIRHSYLYVSYLHISPNR